MAGPVRQPIDIASLGELKLLFRTYSAWVEVLVLCVSTRNNTVPKLMSWRCTLFPHSY
jgi:hypothetical protein